MKFCQYQLTKFGQGNQFQHVAVFRSELQASSKNKGGGTNRTERGAELLPWRADTMNN